jgi:hypothetical protein
MHRRLAKEDGVSLISVAIWLFVLTGFLVFVLDNGVLMVGRHQAQNAADAGALAGVISLVYDEPTTYPPAAGGPTTLAIQTAVRENPSGWDASWGLPVISWQCPNFGRPPGGGGKCVRVDVHADTTNGSQQMPVFVGGLFGLSGMSTRATATAEVRQANWSPCVKPWMVMDWWEDINGNGLVDGTEVYDPPGYRYPEGVTGEQITLQAQNGPDTSLSPSIYYRVDLTGGGADAFLENIENCAGVNPIDGFWTLPGVGPNPEDEVLPLVGTVVPLAVFSPVVWQGLDRSSGRIFLPVVQIVGFKITGVEGREVTGEFAQLVGEMVENPYVPTSGGGFVVAPTLIR